MKRPAYRIVVGGTDVTARFQGRCTSITITDQRNMEADTLSITASDHDGRLAHPRRDTMVDIYIGWGNDLVHKGKYQVDEIGHTGPPDLLTISCRAADVGNSVKVKKERSWHKTTIADAVKKIASEHGLTPQVDPALGATLIDHIDQTHESDGHFITRLGQRYDAIATVKDKRLLFMPQGKGVTISGKAIPAFILKRSDGDTHNYTEADRDSKYTGVKAEWQDNNKAKRQTVLAGKEGTEKVLSKSHPTEKEAQAAADGEMGRIQRGSATFSSTLAHGVARLATETPVVLVGWKPEIIAHDWVIKQLTHQVGDNGFTTAVELEVKGAGQAKQQ